ncbi:hypothetical protein [Erwinia sp. 9145]|uniref:hypothetical protein n=1 Tax=Erwinia sp. 9145 TaxID=1500895 RepID=UPI000557159B|nr:hypothetical protein [Erwinia sp. 9145]
MLENDLPLLSSGFVYDRAPKWFREDIHHNVQNGGGKKDFAGICKDKEWRKITGVVFLIQLIVFEMLI